MPWRIAASSTVSPGATWKVWPLGSSRTWWPVAGGSANLGGCCLASAAEFAFDQVAVDRPAYDRVRYDARTGEQQQREGDQVRDHAGEDEEQAGKHRARAVGKRRDGETTLCEPRCEA